MSRCACTVIPRLQDHLGLDVNSASNLLLLQKAAKKRFDDFRWTLKPLVPTMGQGPQGQPRSQQEFKVTALAQLGIGAQASRRGVRIE